MLSKTKSALAIAAATLAVSFGAHAATDASVPASDAPPAHAPHHGHGGPGGPHGPGGPGGPGFAHVMDHLHKQLKLDAQQEAAWKQAEQTAHANFDTMRTTHEAARQQLKDAASQPILDLAALQAQHEQLESSDAELRTATEKAFVTFYGTLTDAQKTIVSNDIKSQWKHMLDRPHGPPPGDHDGPPPHGEPGDAPPPPPPADSK